MMGDSKRRQQNGLPPAGLGLVGGGERRVSTAQDRLGRTLRPGDLLALPQYDGKDLLWAVEDVRPNLHPNAPPNSVTVSIVARNQIVVTGGTPILQILRVQEAPTAAQVAAQAAEAVAPAEDAPLPTDAELPAEEPEAPGD